MMKENRRNNIKKKQIACIAVPFCLLIIFFYSFNYQEDQLTRIVTYPVENNGTTEEKGYTVLAYTTLDHVNTTFTSKFDQIQNILYEKASKPVQKTRTEFTLKKWEKGDGGLNDEDRKTLGELYYNAESVFEFGLGESTRIAAFVGVPRYTGMDSDAVWVSQSRDEAKGMDHFRFIFADVGQTMKWGYPKKQDLQKNAFDYQIASLMTENSAFDVYLVDGRSRVACACISFLHAMKHGAKLKDVRVAVHDNDQFRGYDVLKNVADVVIENQKLWVYRLQDGIQEGDLFKLWEEYHQIYQR